MKAILVIDAMPCTCMECKLFWNDVEDCGCMALGTKLDMFGCSKGTPTTCPLGHPLKYVSNDFYIYDTKYLMENLDREFELLKGVKEYESHSCD